MNTSQEPQNLFRPIVESFRIVILVTFLGLLFGFWRTQVLHHSRYIQLAESNRTYEQILYAPRGLITDRNGVILADTRFIPMLIWQPITPTDPVKFLSHYADLVRLDNTSRERLMARASQLSSVYPEPLNLPLSLPTISRFEFFKAELSHLAIQDRPVRVYPLGPILAPLIGYTGWISPEDLASAEDKKNWPPNSIVGKSGLEKFYENSLHGTVGSVEYIVDHLGRRVRENVEARFPAKPGANLILTLDAALQKEAYRVLQDYKGAFVALDAATGAVRAMVSSPSFDANRFIPFIEPKLWRDLVNDPGTPLQNRTLQGLYPPGSALKPFIAIVALLENWVTPQTTVFCPGSIQLFNHTFHCWQPQGHGALSLNPAIVHSCDVYFYTLGARVEINELARGLQQFGFGQKTLVDNAPEAEGLIPTREWKERTRGEHWYQGETVSVAIGQGPILVTPLQMAAAMAQIWNEGVRYRPFIVERIVAEPETSFIERKPIVVSRYREKHEYWKFIKETLCDAVRHGTGRKAFDEKIVICGKTGTVELLSKTKKHAQETIEKYQYHTWFTGWVELPNETLAFALILERSGGHGGDVAAPKVRTIFKEYLQILLQRGTAPVQKPIISRIIQVKTYASPSVD